MVGCLLESSRNLGCKRSLEVPPRGCRCHILLSKCRIGRFMKVCCSPRSGRVKSPPGDHEKRKPSTTTSPRHLIFTLHEHRKWISLFQTTGKQHPFIVPLPSTCSKKNLSFSNEIVGCTPMPYSRTTEA